MRLLAKAPQSDNICLLQARVERVTANIIVPFSRWGAVEPWLSEQKKASARTDGLNYHQQACLQQHLLPFEQSTRLKLRIKSKISGPSTLEDTVRWGILSTFMQEICCAISFTNKCNILLKWK